MGKKVIEGVEVTDRQLQILRIIRTSHEVRGCAPTIRELCALAGVRSAGSINKHIYALERKGLIKREVATWRSPTLTKLGRRIAEVEIYGLRPRRG
jgi:repressor LexA